MRETKRATRRSDKRRMFDVARERAARTGNVHARARTALLFLRIPHSRARLIACLPSCCAASNRRSRRGSRTPRGALAPPRSLFAHSPRRRAPLPATRAGRGTAPRGTSRSARTCGSTARRGWVSCRHRRRRARRREIRRRARRRPKSPLHRRFSVFFEDATQFSFSNAQRLSAPNSGVYARPCSA